jgi:phosphomannomutase
MTGINEIWKSIQSADFDPVKQSNLVETVKKAALTSDVKAVVSFGTSGWRGEIGSEFTVKNIQIVAKAILKMYEQATPELWGHLGISSFEELKTKGLVIGHDNRLLGKEFCEVVADIFLKSDIKVFYCGEASTPEYSAVVEMLGAACAINMTPSHNPSNYAGIKFNPADGGPAGAEITSLITDNSNELMADYKFEPLGAINWQVIDSVKIYQDFLIKQGTFDLEKIKAFVHTADLALVTDFVHGATRGRPDFLLDNPPCLQTLRANDDPLFGGIAPEPSSANLAGVRKLIDASSARFKLGVIFDPDGDRIRFYDGSREIEMNAFGAMAFHYMYAVRKEKGVVAKSVATSNFVNVIANRLGAEVAETAVGFKNFRPFMKRDASPKALISFEESDGISGLNNTIEKDAQFGLLLALEIMAVTQKNLGEYLDELYAEFGRLYPERSGFSVDKQLVGAPLIAKVNAIAAKLQKGSLLKIGNTEKKVAEILTLDGVKVIFEDDSWLLVRPSGTEPKVRIYTEVRNENEKESQFEAAKALFFG